MPKITNLASKKPKWQPCPELLVQSRGSRSRTAPLFRRKG